ncbi:histidine phosphatase family protein [Thalassobacillus hwangdonensis]|uniref:Histidine phosphatase family protein n=1 Tax=Thalassobacillus hwangdonensis TaxID=546108 RepID=A0ABW3KZQ3_9BACI
MGKLILIKHAMPALSEHTPSNQWQLTEEGRKQARSLGEKLKDYSFLKVYSSKEPKAVDTAKEIAAASSVEVEEVHNLHEHVRETNRIIYPRKEWREIIQKFFDHPSELIFGDETADQARERFSKAVKQVLEGHPDEEDVIVVTHGTVMTLFITQFNDLDAFTLWDTFGLPSYAELDRENLSLSDIVNMEEVK